MKTALVCGAGGFIGAHMVRRLKAEGIWVRGVDLKHPEYAETAADDFLIGDLRDPDLCRAALDRHFDEVYQFAADMGGAGYVFVGDNDADIMHNSATINLNVLRTCADNGIRRLFYASSACVYPAYNQEDPDSPVCSENTVYPACPDSEYGWEKLFSERLYLAFARNKGIESRIGRYHNIFGPEGAWNDGREKVPAALCRKVAMAREGGEIELWGDGRQTRSFLFIDECIEATLRLTRSDWTGPVNIGSDELISINELARRVMSVAGKSLGIKHVPGPLGVRGRNSDNRLYQEKLGWRVSQPLLVGLEKTYPWIKREVERTIRSSR
ncbi:MAG: NAD-dependent epimerase/dehydratase family protein [Proteobacteria bacterium]|nr:MAG: NAD-dependent epimerase/dehydratase family protein [Pseudomonadota bacterium]